MAFMLRVQCLRRLYVQCRWRFYVQCLRRLFFVFMSSDYDMSKLTH